VLFAGLFLVACEQVVVNGPVGGAAITVTELRSGEIISENTIQSDDLDAAMVRWGDAFEDFVPLQLQIVLGIALLNTLPVESDAWYLVTAEGGFDYSGYPDEAPVQVQGPVRAIMKGAQLESGGFVVGPLSEAAYQWLAPWLDSLDDAELETALVELAEATVTDIHEAGGQLDYSDLLHYNPLFHPAEFTGSQDALAAMRQALLEGDSDVARLAIAGDLAPANAPRVAAEAVFRDNISPNIAQADCVNCHRAGGAAGATRHRLVRTSADNHIATNVQMYADLVDAIGVSRIVSKAQGGAGHGGGVRLSSGSQALADLEAFLEML
jgi:hypothetical protein